MDLIFSGEVPVPREWEGLSWEKRREIDGAGWALTVSTARTAHGACHRLRTRLDRDETNIFFSPDGSRVSVHWNNETSDDEARWADLSTWVVDAALGFSARLRGWPVLHASSVVVDGQAIGLAGHKGAGKSTLAAAFVAGGFPALADDHVVLREEGTEFVAQPGPPALKLWPASVPVLAAEADELPRAYSYMDKRRVDLRREDRDEPMRFHDGPLPLRALYVLEPRDPSRTEVAIEPMSAAAALHQLLVFRWSRFSITPEHSAAELQVLSRLARTVPVSRVHRPDGLETLPRVVRAIRDDVSAEPG